MAELISSTKDTDKRGDSEHEGSLQRIRVANGTLTINFNNHD